MGGFLCRSLRRAAFSHTIPRSICVCLADRTPVTCRFVALLSHTSPLTLTSVSALVQVVIQEGKGTALGEMGGVVECK